MGGFLTAEDYESVRDASMCKFVLLCLVERDRRSFQIKLTSESSKVTLKGR